MLQDPGLNLLDLPVAHRAQHIALLAHGATLNKHDGELYLLHVHRVVMLAESLGADDVTIAVAWLHDVVEDTDVTMEDIWRLFPDYASVPHSVDAITKRDGETLKEYRVRLGADYDACFVKLHADGVDNFRRNHSITEPERKSRMTNKYSENFDYLSFKMLSLKSNR